MPTWTFLLWIIFSFPRFLDYYTLQMDQFACDVSGVGIWEMTTWSLTLTLWTHVRTKQTAEYYCHSNYGIYQRTYKWVNRITSVYGSSIPNTREDATNPVQEGQRIQHRCGINKRQITYIDWLDWITSSPGQTEHSSRRFLPDQSKTLFCDDTIKGAEDENINDV